MMHIRQITAAFGLCLAICTADAAPSAINYQGRLLDNGGAPVNGSVPVAVTVWSADTGGSLLYTQHVGSVAVENGLYDFEWGDSTLATALTNAQCWLQVHVNSETLAPRQRLLAVPYALRAGSVEGSSGGGMDFAEARNALFGDGVDGDAAISGTVTLTRDMFYNNLTIEPGAVLKPSGWVIRVKGTLTNNGTIHRAGTAGGAGGNGSGTTGGTAGSGGSGSLGGTFPAIEPGAAGGTGGKGGSTGNSGQPGVAGSGYTNALAWANGATGGAGGSGDRGGSLGGTGGVSVSAITASFAGQSSSNARMAELSGDMRLILDRPILHTLIGFSDSETYRAFTAGGTPGGGGGGGGGGNTHNSSGGGGGGAGSSGGIIAVLAYHIAQTGTIDARGGAGGTGGLPVEHSSSNRGGGGGGGGGGTGGSVFLAYSRRDSAGNLLVSGGAGGTGGVGIYGNSGANGAVGADGQVLTATLDYLYE